MREKKKRERERGRKKKKKKEISEILGGTDTVLEERSREEVYATKIRQSRTVEPKGKKRQPTLFFVFFLYNTH